MAPTEKRKTGVFGMSDLKKPTHKKQKTSVFGMGNLNKPTQTKRKTGVFGMSDLDKKSKEADAKGRTGTRRLQDLIPTELSADDGLMDDLALDHTLGVPKDENSGDEASEDGSFAAVNAGDDEPGDEGPDEEDDDYVSEADEVGSSDEGEDDDDSVEEEVIEKAVQEDLRKNHEKAFHQHNRMLERVEADNQFVAKMTDEDLESQVVRDTEGGYFEVVPVREGEEVPASDLVDLEEIEPGVWYDSTTRELYQRTEFIDPKTNKVLKTVRRHPKGPPKGLTYKVTKISANAAKNLKAGAEEYDPPGRA